MGILYYAVNHTRKTVYQLGKGFYLDPQQGFRTDMSVEELVALMSYCWPYSDDKEFLPLMANELVNQLGGVEDITSDETSYPEEYLDYLFVGSRYKDEDTLKDIGKKVADLYY
jgi:hypothetical protein